MKIATRLQLESDTSRLNKIIYSAQKELKEVKKQIALSHEIHGDRWETAKYDFIKEVTIRKEYFVPEGTITKYKLIAK
tara:strand:+ start:672 stop:905 length:234 start_codon:yes stop_codon:yes gene_type:complete